MLYLLPIVALLLPSISIGLLYTHALAKATIILLLAYNVIQGIIKGKNTVPHMPKELIFLFSFYCIRILFSFVHQDTSILWEAVETNVFFALMVLYISLIVESKKQGGESIIRVLTGVFISYTLLNYFLFVFKDSFLLLLQPILHEGTHAIIQMNLDRGRLFFDNYPELLIPLFMANKHLSMRARWVGVGIVVFIVLASGFRTNFVMAIFAFILSGFVFYEDKIIKIIKGIHTSLVKGFVVVVVILTLLVGLRGAVDTGYLRNNALERLLSDEQAERSTIEGRLVYAKLGTELFLSNPLMGVGTGAFRDYLTIRKDRYSIKRANLQIFDDARDPHQFLVTIASEGGIIALTLFSLFIIYSFRSDWKRRTVGSILFWTLFLYGMANPVATSIPFHVLLILFRYI